MESIKPITCNNIEEIKYIQYHEGGVKLANTWQHIHEDTADCANVIYEGILNTDRQKREVKCLKLTSRLQFKFAPQFIVLDQNLVGDDSCRVLVLYDHRPNGQSWDFTKMFDDWNLGGLPKIKNMVDGGLDRYSVLHDEILNFKFDWHIWNKYTYEIIPDETGAVVLPTETTYAYREETIYNHILDLNWPNGIPTVYNGAGGFIGNIVEGAIGIFVCPGTQNMDISNSYRLWFQDVL